MSDHDLGPLPPAEREALAAGLPDLARKVLLRAGTEPPGTYPDLGGGRPGTFCCALCGLPLYPSTAKYDSGTGWPSFYEPVDDEHLSLRWDFWMILPRRELRCRRCDGHLGHVFGDGPPPTGKRHCINGAALRFVEEGEEIPGRAWSVET